MRPADAEEPLATPRRPPFDPLDAPTDPAFADPGARGAPVDPARLTSGALRSRFRDPPAWQPEPVRDDKFIVVPGEPRPAAVLVPLVVRAEAITVLLTERTAHLMDHAGQISFPGGRVEPGDVDPVATALRETTEELGLAASRVEVLGSLPLYLTGTGFAVTPVVGLVTPPLELAPDAFEVAEAFEVPLAFLMDPARHERRIAMTPRGPRTFYAMPYHAGRVYFIWGATAAMLRNLYRFLSA